MNFKNIIILVVLMLPMSSVFAQQASSAGIFDPSAKTNEINSASNKLPYLQEFLASVKTNPAKYCNEPKTLRDSVNTHMQLDLSALNFSVFKDYKDKSAKKISDETNKAYVIGMQMIFAGQFLPDRQKELEKHIVKVNELIEKTGFMKQSL